MRKRTKMIIDPKYVLIIVVVMCVLLMGVSFKFYDKMQPIRAAVFRYCRIRPCKTEEI